MHTAYKQPTIQNAIKKDVHSSLMWFQSVLLSSMNPKYSYELLI
jgi:hypothetical protein